MVTLRAKVFPRWAAAVLLAGLVVTLGAAIAPAMARPSAVVFGLSLVALGQALATGRAGERAGVRGESRQLTTSA